MNWVKNHTCKNCKYSAKVDKSNAKYAYIYVLSDSDEAVDWCIYHGQEIPADVGRCTCDDWSEDEEAIAGAIEEEKLTEDELKYCSCGGEPFMTKK